MNTRSTGKGAAPAVRDPAAALIRGDPRKMGAPPGERDARSERVVKGPMWPFTKGLSIAGVRVVVEHARRAENGVVRLRRVHGERRRPGTEQRQLERAVVPGLVAALRGGAENH